MKKFFYNENHEYARGINHKGELVRYRTHRDLTGHWGIACNRCKKEIFGEPAWTKTPTETGVEHILRGKKTFVPYDPKFPIQIELLVAGVQEGAAHICNTCEGWMRDFYDKNFAKNTVTQD